DDDDDDDGGDPGSDFLGLTYCLDWDTVTVEEPAAFGSLVLTYVGDYALLLSPTGVSSSGNVISMLGAPAENGTCAQDMTLNTVSASGIYVAPHFEVGPVDVDLQSAMGEMTVYGLTVEGDFTGDASQIENSVLEGVVDITDYGFLLCSGTPSPCFPCPSGTGQCVDFRAVEGQWNDSGAGALSSVP
ncbi:MAG TPA: hypothetical protein DIU15_17895, partial [Deltaproteobacteria bacterium]|nr:hypothetical protein [Deltaproteobacteria bacterium]